MNITEMRTIVRKDLHDNNEAGHRWTDEEIDRHIQHAVRDFSEAFPEEAKMVKTTTAGSRSLDISDVIDRVIVEAVEYPVGLFPPRFQRFAKWGDVLMLLGDEIPDGTNVCIYYGRLHKLDTGATIPVLYEDVIATGAAGYAAIQWAAFAINQVNTGGTQTPEEFLTWGTAKLEQFETRIKSLGRRNRIRVQSLYRPFRPATGKTTGFGP